MTAAIFPLRRKIELKKRVQRAHTPAVLFTAGRFMLKKSAILFPIFKGTAHPHHFVVGENSAEFLLQSD